MIIGIDMGHTLTGVGTGAIGKYGKETDKNREVGKKLISLLQSHGHKVVNCTVDKSNNDLSDRCRLANKQKLDLFISLHLNSHYDKDSNGVEVFSLATTGKGREYAIKLSKALSTMIGWRNRGAKTKNFYVLRNTNAPAVLIELGFCTNETDMKLWNTHRIAVTIARVVTGETYETSKPTEQTKPQNKLYRVKLNGTQIGAYSKYENVINRMKEIDSAKIKDINISYN